MNVPSPSPDSGRVRFRKLRIAFSATCLIACVLLIVLWVRSYWWSDDLFIRLPNPQRKFVIHSILGGTVWYSNERSARASAWTHKYWGVESDSVAALTKDLTVSRTDNLFRIEVYSSPMPSFSRLVALPHWLFVAVFAALATAPWLRWRFSLRTLLIATTLVAVILGAIIFAAK
jgi:hypothetical protein